MTAVSTETPRSASNPRMLETLKGVWVSHSAISAPTGSVIENGPVHVARSRQNHFGKPVLLPFAKAQLAVDVLDHHDGAVDDDSEVDRADGEKICRLSGQVQKNKGEEQSQGDGEGGNDGRPETHQKEDK